MPFETSLTRVGRGAPRCWLIAAGSVALVIGLVGTPAVAQAPPPSTTTTVPDVDPPKTEEEKADAKEALLKTLELAPREQPPSPDDVFEEAATADALVDELALIRLEITAKASDANITAFAAAQELKKVKDKETLAKAVRDDATDELSDERERMADLTVRAYVAGGEVDLEHYRAFVEGDTTDPGAGRTIMFNQVLDLQEQVTKEARQDLKVAKKKLADVRVLLRAAEVKAARLLGIASDLTRKRMNAERRHIEAIIDADNAEKSLRTAALTQHGVVVPQEVAIIGMPRLSPSDLAGWFAQSSYRPKVKTPIADYAKWFIEEGRSEGIRGDIAFAQAVLETGGFTNTDSVMANNFSGIGHYDNLSLGWIFPSPRIGVRAQIQLLKSYAVDKKQLLYANKLVDKRLHGPSGCCQTWGDLTTVWATDPTYGPKVMLIYTSIVDYALLRRARGEGFDDELITGAPDEEGTDTPATTD